VNLFVKSHKSGLSYLGICLILMLCLVISGSIFAQDKKTVVWNEVHSGTDPMALAAEAIKKEFEAKYPEINLVFNQTEHELAKTLIRMWLSSDDPPDVVSWQGGSERLGGFVRRGYVMDVTDLWESKGYYDKFLKPAIDRVTFDGRQYGIPFVGTFNGVFYRKSVWEKLGFTEPNTWEEFLALCEKFKEQGITPIAIGLRHQKWPAAFWFTYLDLRINGLDFDSQLAQGKISYMDPKVENVFKVWKSLIDKGYFLKDMGAYDLQESTEALVRGEAGMYLMGHFVTGFFPEEEKSDIGVFPLPVIDSSVGNYEMYYGDVKMIAKNAPHPEEALLLLDFMASKEMQELAARISGNFFEQKEVPADLYIPALQELKEYYDTKVEGTISFYDRVVPAAMYDKGLDAFVEFMLFPETYKEIMAKLENYRQQFYEE
jgi:ABC-type glycerol-3-phosphate transport system substrate-binding protein